MFYSKTSQWAQERILCYDNTSSESFVIFSDPNIMFPLSGHRLVSNSPVSQLEKFACSNVGLRCIEGIWHLGSLPRYL